MLAVRFIIPGNCLSEQGLSTLCLQNVCMPLPSSLGSNDLLCDKVLDLSQARGNMLCASAGEAAARFVNNWAMHVRFSASR